MNYWKQFAKILGLELGQEFSWNAGNCFKTKEEAQTKGKEVMEQIRKKYDA